MIRRDFLATEFSDKYIRDPLYGFIGISKQEEKIIQTPIFQRLRRIKQLSNTHLVFPGATHTRFEHSLGVLHLAGRVAARLNLTEEETKTLRLAALLHDIGHGPFSHIFETPMKLINGEDFKHEDVTIFLIKYDKDLDEALGRYKDDVLSIFENEGNLSYRIISSGIDIDKMDYFRRDSYHAGVDYGIYDFNRIMLTLCKISRFGEKYLGIHEKGVRAVESFRLARFNLWDQVYEHHTRVIADKLLIRSLKYAIDEKAINVNHLKLNESNPDNFCQYYKDLDDYSLQHEILVNSNDKAANIINKLRSRNLLKRAYRIPIDKSRLPDPTIRRNIIKQDVEKTEKEIADEVGIDPDQILIYIQNFPIKGYSTGDEIFEEDEEILVKMRNEEVRELSTISPLTIQFKSIRRLYVFCVDDKDIKKNVCKKCECMFGAKSDLEI